MRPKLDPITEMKLRSLGNRRFAFVLTLTLLWFVVVIMGWIMLSSLFNRSTWSPSTMLTLILLVFPFWPCKAYRVLFAKTFYATVTSVKNTDHFFGPVMYFDFYEKRDRRCQIASVVRFLGDDKEHHSQLYVDDAVTTSRCFYREGDRVFVIRGLRFPVQVPIPAEGEVLCPKCGCVLKNGKRRCMRCGVVIS